MFALQTLLWLFLPLWGLTSYGQNASFVWTANPSTTDPGTNTTGYKLYWGTQSGTYTQTYDAGNATSASFPVPAGNYFAVVKAYNANGAESAPSAEIQFTVAAISPTPSPTPTYEKWIQKQNDWTRANPPVAD